jgi:PAS domain S-box-containing protein
VSDLRDIGGDVEAALEHISVPSYVIDTAGVIRWVNPAAERIVGDVRGRQFTSVIAREESRRAREVFQRNLAGKVRVADVDTVLVDATGDRVSVEISSVRLMRGHHVVGIFGQVVERPDVPATPTFPHLTPRQQQVLGLLEHGRSTAQIAEELHIERETVRNHVRHLFRALGVHSRLEAVALARSAHLVAQ